MSLNQDRKTEAPTIVKQRGQLPFIPTCLLGNGKIIKIALSVSPRAGIY